MARIRTIKPGFFASEDMAKHSLRARLTFAGLWTYADDYGNANANTRLIKAALWSLDDAVTPADIQDDLDALVLNGQIRTYQVDGRSYIHIVKWSSHQRVDRPSVSQIPAPSWITREDESSPQENTLLEVEGKGEDREVERASAPTLAKTCPKHPEGTDKPCRACQTARLKWEAAQNATVSGIQNDPVCVHHLPPKQCPDCRKEAA